MSISIDKFFRVWGFLKNNPYTATKTNLAAAQESTPTVSKLYSDTLNLTEDTLMYPKDLQLIEESLRSRDKIWNFFSKVMVPGSYAYNTVDMDLYRKMIIDWSSASKTFQNMFLRASDAFSLDDDDVDKAIRGFGVDFLNKSTQSDIIQRQLFLLTLCDLYKIKGSPQSITKSLTFAGISKSILREYWIERDPAHYRTLQVRGKAIDKYKQDFNSDTNSYDYVNDPTRFGDMVMSWDAFQNRLWDISEPHWWYTSDEILDIDYDIDTKLKLPSLTPYFGIEFISNMKDFNVKMGILEKILSDQTNAFISGNKDIIPTDMSISVDENIDRTRRDLWITGYPKSLTLIECFLGFTYCQIRYDEYIQYNHLSDYLSNHGVLVPDIYSYPYSFQELVYWIYTHKTQSVNTVLTVDSMARNYIPGKTNYYCSTNALAKWWIERPLDDGETVAHTFDNIPDIFFSHDYQFRYLIHQQNTLKDQILMYNGLRQLDYKTSPFEYYETISDANTLRESKTTRVEASGHKRTINTDGDVDAYYPTINDVQNEYINTFFSYISSPSSTYVDTVEHDGSVLTPQYFDKYPKSYLKNWAIDSDYLYTCYEYNKWARSKSNQIEYSWLDYTNVKPTSNGTFTYYSGTTQKTLNVMIGDRVLCDDYIYSYVSTNTWIRYSVDTNWDTSTAPISPTGFIQLDSKIAFRLVKAIINSDDATTFINNGTFTKITIQITLNPLSEPIVKYFTLDEFSDYLSINKYILDRTGCILKPQNLIYEDGYLYTRLSDYGNDYTECMWVRNEVDVDWSSNGTAIYTGDYKFPSLDLTDRYDAERLLRGEMFLTLEELESSTTSYTIGDQRLVCAGSNGYPEIYIYGSSGWSLNPVNTINDINLGFNNDLIEWIDSSVSDENDYQTYADKFLNTLSSYVKIQFQDQDFDVAGIYKAIQNSGLIKNLIDFFKPKRARLLFFAIDVDIDDRLFNSVKIADDLPLVRVTQYVTDPISNKTCCDYYDTGCNHDGPTNPKVVTYGSGEWSNGQYSNHDIFLKLYDDFTNHHQVDGFITDQNSIVNYIYQDQTSQRLRNPGNTYCNECDITTYIPEGTNSLTNPTGIFAIPNEWIRCGVFHTKILGSGFDTSAYNAEWTAGTMISCGNNDFPIGYWIDTNGGTVHSAELVHVYNKSTAKYYWELRNISGGLPGTVVATTTVRDGMHSMSDFTDTEILNNNRDRSDFLNGVYLDVVNELWSGVDGTFELTSDSEITSDATCGKILPYKETYIGTVEYETGWSCYVRFGNDEKIFQYKYTALTGSPDPDTIYRQIVNLENGSDGKFIRFIPESIATTLSDPIDCSLIDSKIQYKLRNYIEPNLLINTKWTKKDLFTRELIDPYSDTIDSNTEMEMLT